MTEEFNLKMWVCVSINFDAKKVIADMLESLKKRRRSQIWVHLMHFKAKVIGGVLKDNLDKRALGDNSTKQFIWPEFYRFHLMTELYSFAKTSTKLFCILLHVLTRS
ncbi:hypothetical protein IEQ34_019870 [Dendrobium chrysotoxum]|uniref:Uncharacterized protein n=1 Tax=Dendrobium chrysotoxum TaxID=161865 RepID=A0AAV7G8N5_DENCH|nr:hypothetical protein IEQ34_019870 [Dendrobium chrysotoxum]